MQPEEFPPIEGYGRYGPFTITVLGEIPEIVEPELVRGPEPTRRRVFLPVCLFLATCVTTFMTGVAQWDPGQFFTDAGRQNLADLLSVRWPEGLVYMASVMGILLAHEMGHFLQALRYRVPASLPFFIPMPLTPIGTMGAVISMQGSRADRKQMFDIGISGPLAGLVVAVPLMIYGVLTAENVVPLSGSMTTFGNPLLVELMIRVLPIDVPTSALNYNPVYMAAWVGMLVTGLNMLPVSQLDGGHVAYALFGRRAYVLARLMVLAVMGYIVISGQYGWLLMLFLVMMIGTDHPPTRDDRVPIGPVRQVIGTLSLLIPIFCLTPVPFSQGM